MTDVFLDNTLDTKETVKAMKKAIPIKNSRDDMYLSPTLAK